MGEIIVVIKSRSAALRFADELKTYRIACKVINTPKEAGVGCGLSVKMFMKDFKRAQTVSARTGIRIDAVFAYESGRIRRLQL